MKPSDHRWIRRQFEEEAAVERGLARQAEQVAADPNTDPRVIAHTTTAKAFERMGERIKRA